MAALKFDPSKISRSAPASAPPGFSLVGQTPAEQRDAVQVPLKLIDPYTDPKGNGQPFRMYSEDAMEQMEESVRQNGILEPVLLRPMFGGRYQTLAGHNRIAAATAVGLVTVPAIIRPCNDNEAALAVVDTNLNQRHTLLPSERAAAYKIKIEALKRQNHTLGTSEEQSRDTAEQLAEEGNGNRRSIFRYLRLNELEPPLLNKVDSGSIPLVAGVSLSYLNPSQQKLLEQTMLVEKVAKITPPQALELRHLAEIDGLTQKSVKETLGCVAQEKPLTLTVKIPIGDRLTAKQLKELKKKLKEKVDLEEEAFSGALLDFLQNALKIH